MYRAEGEGIGKGIMQEDYMLGFYKKNFLLPRRKRGGEDCDLLSSAMPFGITGVNSF